MREEEGSMQDGPRSFSIGPKIATWVHVLAPISYQCTQVAPTLGLAPHQFDKKCLKIPKNNFKLGPKLIFEKKIFWTTGNYPVTMTKIFEKIFLTKNA